LIELKLISLDSLETLFLRCDRSSGERGDLLSSI
jgi:hypothetical protein